MPGASDTSGKEFGAVGRENLIVDLFAFILANHQICRVNDVA